MTADAVTQIEQTVEQEIADLEKRLERLHIKREVVKEFTAQMAQTRRSRSVDAMQAGAARKRAQKKTPPRPADQPKE